MVYVPHPKGPNDHKKGNRTRGKDRRGNRTGSPDGKKNLSGLQEANAERTARAEYYDRIAEHRAKLIRYGQDYALPLMEKLAEYIERQQENRKPLTIAGLVRASGVSADTYYRFRDGDCDRLLYEWMDLHGVPYDMEGQQITTDDGETVLLCRLSTIVKTAELAVQEQLEENCYTNKGNPAGSIFGLKARYDWQDTPPDQRTTTNNTLVLNNVATLDEARAAMKRLNE